MENEIIIRHRLLTGTSTTRGEPPLKKLALACAPHAHSDRPSYVANYHDEINSLASLCWHRANTFCQGGPQGHAEKQYKQLCSEVFNVDYMVTSTGVKVASHIDLQEPARPRCLRCLCILKSVPVGCMVTSVQCFKAHGVECGQIHVPDSRCGGRQVSSMPQKGRYSATTRSVR